MSLATASCDLWQNEQRNISSDPDLVFTGLTPYSRGNSTNCRSYPLSRLIDDIVYDSVFLSLLRVHDEVALDIFLDLVQFLTTMLGK